MKKIGLKKKVLSLLFASAVVIPTAFLVSACGDEPEPEKLARTNTVELVGVQQDYQGGVYVELKNFEHEGYEVASDEGITSSSLEFSINGSEWARGDYIADFYDEYNKAIYQIMYYDYSANDFKMSYSWSDDSFAVGQTINISVRIPESDTYKASEGKNVASFTLKNVPSSISDSFDSFVNNTPDNTSSTTGENNSFVFYVDGSTLKVGKYETTVSGGEWNPFKMIRFENLTEQDKAELDALNLEFKLVDFNSTLVNKTSIEGTNYVSEEIGNVDSAENYFHTVSPREWRSLKKDGYAVNINVADNKIWDLNSYVDDGFGGYSLVNSKSLVLLVRQGETQSTGVSEILQINYNISQTSSLLDISGDYVKIEMETTEDGQQPVNPTQATQAMTTWMGGEMESTAIEGYSGAIKFDYSDSTNKYQLQGTVENKYADASLQVFTTNTELSDLINGGYNYIISGTIDTDTTSGATNETKFTISQGENKPEYIFNEDMTSLILQALQIDIIKNMLASSDIDIGFFESIDSDYMKIKITFGYGEAYLIFDSVGNFVGHRLAFSSDTMSYSVEFKIN